MENCSMPTLHFQISNSSLIITNSGHSASRNLPHRYRKYVAIKLVAMQHLVFATYCKYSFCHILHLGAFVVSTNIGKANLDRVNYLLSNHLSALPRYISSGQILEGTSMLHLHVVSCGGVECLWKLGSRRQGIDLLLGRFLHRQDVGTATTDETLGWRLKAAQGISTFMLTK